MPFNLHKHSQMGAEQAAGDVRDSLENATNSLGGETAPPTIENIEQSVETEDQRTVLEQQQIQALMDAVNRFLQDPTFASVSSSVMAEPEMQTLFNEGNAYPLKDKIQEMGLEGAAAQLVLPENQLIPEQELRGYFDRLKRVFEERARTQEVGQMGAGITGRPVAFNLKNHKTAQVQAPDIIDATEKGQFVARYLDVLMGYNPRDKRSIINTERAKEEIKRMVSPSFENDVVDALEAIQVLDPVAEKDKAARYLEEIYTSFVATDAYATQPMEPIMSEKTPKGIIKFNLSDHIINQPMEKTATAFQSQEYVLYGPTEKRICPKLRGKKSGGGDVVSEYVCRHHCLDGIVIDDNKTICGEALWRANVMDKQSREYVDEDGIPTGGYINKRFQVDYNVPEDSNMRLKPGELRKPRPPEMGNIESRMQAMRKAEGEKRGYRPDTNTGDPFRWDKDVDQNNVEQTQATRDKREEAMGHQMVQYSEKPPTENKPKVAAVDMRYEPKEPTKLREPLAHGHCGVCKKLVPSSSLFSEESGTGHTISVCPSCRSGSSRQGFNLGHYKEAKGKKWIQDADLEEGSFTEYCGGKVTDECVAKGKKSPEKKTQQRAELAETFREMGGKKKGFNLKQHKTAGYKNVSPISEKYAQLEGPFRMPDGRVIYYDSSAGQYFDRKSGVYLDQKEAEMMHRNFASKWQGTYKVAKDQIAIEIKKEHTNKNPDQLAMEIKKDHKEAECPHPLPNDNEPIEPKEKKTRKDNHYSRKIKGFNLKQYKKAFEYEGEEFDVNPFAICHTTVDKDKNPEKYERCVQKVKSKSRKDMEAEASSKKKS